MIEVGYNFISTPSQLSNAHSVYARLIRFHDFHHEYKILLAQYLDDILKNALEGNINLRRFCYCTYDYDNCYSLQRRNRNVYIYLYSTLFEISFSELLTHLICFTHKIKIARWAVFILFA